MRTGDCQFCRSVILRETIASPFAGGAKTRRCWSRAWLTLTLSAFLLSTPLRAEFAYVVNFSDNTVSAYSVDANGALTAVPGSPFSTGTQPTSVAVDPTGTFVYVVNGGDSTVSAYSIGTNGTLTTVPGSPFAAGLGPYAVTVEPRGKFVYVTDENAGKVSAYRIGANGALTPVPGSPFAAGLSPNAVAVDPKAKFVYVANGRPEPNARHKTVRAYRISANGGLKPISDSPFAMGPAPIAIAVDPNGNFVYVANYHRDKISAAAIASNGELTSIAGSPFPGPGGPYSIAIDPAAKFAFVANDNNNTA